MHVHTRRHHKARPHGSKYGRALRTLSSLAVSARLKRPYGRTRTKTDVIHNSNDDIHSGKTKETAVIVLNKKHLYVKEPICYMQQNGNYMASSAGKQALWEISQDFSIGQLTATAPPPPSYADPGFGQYSLPLFWMNPNKKTTTGIGVGGMAALAGYGYNAKLKLQRISYEFQFNNATNTSGDVVLYCVTPKKMIYAGGLKDQSSGIPFSDLQAGMIQTWWNAYVSNQYPAANVISGAAANATDVSGVDTAPVAGYPGTSTAGFSVFQVPAFRQNFRCLYKKEINLSGGAVHKTEVTVKMNKVISEAAIIQMNSNVSAVDAIPGVTLIWFMVIKGSPAVVSNAGVLPQTNQNTSASLASFAIANTVIKKMHFGFEDGAAVVDEQLAAPTFRTPSGTANVKIENIVDAAANVAFVI